MEPDADAGVDAMTEAAPAEAGGPDASTLCAHDAPFTTMRKLDGINTTTANEFYLRLSGDELVIYFERNTRLTSDFTFYRAERATRSSAFGIPVAVQNLPTNPRHPFPLPGELTLYYAGAAGALYTASRASTSAPYGSPEPVSVFDSGASLANPELSADGTELFFSFARPVPDAGPDFDIWHTFVGEGGFVDASAVNGVNTPGREQGTALSADGLDLYYYADPKKNGAGQIWVAHRDTRSEQFRTPTVHAELSLDAGFSAPGSISSDGCRLYFFSNAGGVSNTYVAERMPR